MIGYNSRDADLFVSSVLSKKRKGRSKSTNNVVTLLLKLNNSHKIDLNLKSKFTSVIAT